MSFFIFGVCGKRPKYMLISIILFIINTKQFFIILPSYHIRLPICNQYNLVILYFYAYVSIVEFLNYF